MSSSPETNTPTASEVEVLRARVAELEERLLETEAWANRAVAAAQERTYWLERWHLDLDALMRRRSAVRARAALRALRGVYRVLVVAKRRLPVGR